MVANSIRGNFLPTWFLISLSCAFFAACCDAISKFIMRDNDEWVTGGGVLLFSTVLLAPLFFFYEFGPITRPLILAFGITLPLEVLGYYLFLSSIRLSPLSLTVPLLSFTPAISIVTSAIILEEQISLFGVTGVGFVTVGAYVLNWDPKNLSFLGPLKAAASDRGARRMLLVAVIWALTSTFGKSGINIYGAMQFGLILHSLITLVFVLAGMVRLINGSTSLKLETRTIAFFGIGAVAMAFQMMTHFIALSMAPVAYMISVKRISMVISVIFGWRFFGEQNIGWRLAGAVIMLVGVTILSVC